MISRSDIVAFVFILTFIIVFGLYLAYQPVPSDFTERYTQGGEYATSGGDVFTHNGRQWKRYAHATTSVSFGYPTSGTSSYTLLTNDTPDTPRHRFSADVYPAEDFEKYEQATGTAKRSAHIAVDIYDRGTSTSLSTWLTNTDAAVGFDRSRSLATSTLDNKTALTYEGSASTTRGAGVMTDAYVVVFRQIGSSDHHDVGSVYDALLDTIRLPSVDVVRSTCGAFVRSAYTEDELAVSERYTDAPSDVDYADHPSAQQFRSTIDDAVGDGPNFAGRYSVATWRCGTRCRGHAVADVSTGSVLTSDLVSQFGVAHSTSSRLLVVNPADRIKKAQPGVPTVSTNAIERSVFMLRSDGDQPLLERICTEQAMVGVE